MNLFVSGYNIGPGAVAACNLLHVTIVCVWPSRRQSKLFAYHYRLCSERKVGGMPPLTTGQQA